MSTDALAREMEQAEAEELSRIEALLPQILHAREGVKLDKELSPVVRQYIALHGREAVVNGELGIVADLGNGATTNTDCRPLTDEQVLFLKGMGLLDIRWVLFDTLRRAAPTVMLDSIESTPGVRRKDEYDTLRVRRLSDV